MPTYTPDTRHDAVGAWFFGPKGENFSHVEQFIKMVLDKQKEARDMIYPNDDDFITQEMRNSSLFKRQMDWLEWELNVLTRMLNNYSVPFWSPRYNAHMSMESSLPSVVGYVTGALHNQNNVATEASPITTLIEQFVGEQLCRMLGYKTIKESEDDVEAWGHITSGGTVANLESMWAARNLKFYPLSLFLAISEGQDLRFLRAGSDTPFNIELCNGTLKALTECTSWELLNLKPSSILKIPDQLYHEHGISATALAAALKQYSIQETGNDYLEKRFQIDLPTQYFVGTTRHYSWPKGAALTGIGANQIVEIPLDLAARADAMELEKLLEKSLQNKQALYAVVAIIGSTEQGAVDPLVDILRIRKKFEARGLSFVVHCDAAWGGYFASMVDKLQEKEREKGKLGWDLWDDSSYVPTSPLSKYTENQLRAFKDADSITIDPHKSGYCPYPAGGLCYRDGRMRYLVTWTSPVIFREGDDPNESMGVFGVEGSKPGAAAVGAYLSHEVIGLNKLGYATLLGETIFTSARLYCQWAAMETKPVDLDGTKVRLVIRPFTMLQEEKDGKSEAEIEKKRQFIRDHILNKSNKEIMDDPAASKVIREVGGDLMINAFACNFEIDGKINEDVVEANYLNSCIFQRLSVTDMEQDIRKVPIFLTSTSLQQSLYTKCLTHYKNRLGLKGEQDLFVLINVTMSPWPSSGNYVQELVNGFKNVAEDLLKAVKLRNVEFPHFHGFVIQGTEHICGVHLPMFNMENHRHQLIISCDFPPKVIEKYRQCRAANPAHFFTFGNMNEAKLMDLIQDGASFKAAIDEGLPEKGGKNRIAEDFTVSNIKILLHRSLHSKDLRPQYPDKMVFYGYGHGTELHIDHLLSTSPNMQLNSERIKIIKASSGKEGEVGRIEKVPANKEGDMGQIEKVLANEGAWLRLTRLNERAMQPLLMGKDDKNYDFKLPGLNFAPGARFAFEAYPSADDALGTRTASRIASGTLQLGPSVFGDTAMLNRDGGIPEHQHHDGDDDSKPGLALPMPPLLPPAPPTLPEASAALAAEYPQATASREFQVLYRSKAMREFKKLWMDYKAQHAEEVEKKHRNEGKQVPEWLKTWRERDGSVEERGPEEPVGAPMSPMAYHQRAGA